MPRGVYKRAKGKAADDAVLSRALNRKDVEADIVDERVQLRHDLHIARDKLQSAARTLDAMWLNGAIAALRMEPPRVGVALERLEMAQLMCRWLVQSEQDDV